jgi:hypothetical protein
MERVEEEEKEMFSSIGQGRGKREGRGEGVEQGLEEGEGRGGDGERVEQKEERA